ncbi:C40 family peptidase [Alicyclobacillus fastidiosus]|uniref:C40 family peptidase n=1 Tax=Alicyclobacillus fastidiosus TaxID=392011 RepID=UPI0023E9878C|nr:NlpC/P60 family protein [Alicyclobacillus fastidiosus]GMA66039.1 hypothetical protein GCM10025859_64810 [Alicyclobacillus fastidiosus]
MKKINKMLATVVSTSMLFVSTAYASTSSTSHSSSNVTITPVTTQSVGQKQNDVYLAAEKLVHNPPRHISFDTPGFVQKVYSAVNVKLPRTILEQSKVGKRISNRSQLQKGDLVFFNLVNSNKNEVTFDGIYLGKNMFAALTTHGLMEINTQSEYWSNKFTFGVRIL